MTDIPQYYVRKSGVNYSLASFTFERESNESIDQTPFETSKANAANLDIGDDVSIGYMDGATFVADFSGDIVEKAVHETSKFMLESYGGRLNRADHFSEIYSNQAPETIAESIIDNQVTTLTYSSTATSGITISEFVVKDETPAEAIGRLVELLNWQLRTDNDKKFYFEPVGNTVNSTVITINSNAHLMSPWNYVPNSIINSLTLKGGSATFNTNQTFTATALQKEFVVNNKIKDSVKVTDDGTEQLGGIEGSTDSYAYTVDSDNKTIVFETGITNGNTVIVYYNYEIPVKITAKNDASITANGTFSRKITEDTLTTMADARKRAKQILATYSELSRSATILVGYDSSFTAGETVNVVDSFNSLDQQLVINQMTLKYPDGTKTVEVGTPKLDQFSWQKGIDSRLRALEQKRDNSDRIQQYKLFKENVNVTLRTGRVRTRSDTIGNSWIVGSPTNGIVGTNTSTQGGGQQVVGESSRTETILSVKNPNDTMYERFNFTNYIDTGNTTATIDTTDEQAEFTDAEILQSLAIAKGATYTTATLTSDATAGFTFQMSPNGGSDWEACTSATLHTFTASGGTDLRYKATYSGSGANIGEIKITYA